jgi:hypothetical protein
VEENTWQSQAYTNTYTPEYTFYALRYTPSFELPNFDRATEGFCLVNASFLYHALRVTEALSDFIVLRLSTYTHTYKYTLRR